MSLKKYLVNKFGIPALQWIAKLHRRTMKTQIIAITGTNGKTTTKELTNAVLSKKFRTVCTQGNYNNHIGVPLTLLKLRPNTQIAVVEMGANHPGEIAFLCKIATPDYGLITNIGKAHLEGFGSFEGVIKTKNELYEYLKTREDTVFVNADNPLLDELSDGMKRITYGSSDAVECKVEFVSLSPFLVVKYNGIVINTNIVGKYNLENVAAAIAIGRHFGVDDTLIKQALEEYRPSNHRSQVIETGKNRIVMDAYNANPVSMREALTNFKEICGEKPLLILGDMLELGDASDAEHQAIVNLIGELGYDKAFLVGSCMGKAAQGSQYSTFGDIEELRSFVAENPVTGHFILIKGSHGMQLEKVLELL